jgi:hypothetical protein
MTPEQMLQVGHLGAREWVDRGIGSAEPDTIQENEKNSHGGTSNR